MGEGWGEGKRNGEGQTGTRKRGEGQGGKGLGTGEVERGKKRKRKAKKVEGNNHKGGREDGEMGIGKKMFEGIYNSDLLYIYIGCSHLHRAAFVCTSFTLINMG